MAKFGSYNNSFSPYMSWYAEYSYSRTSNSNVSVTVTVYGEILNHSASSWMGTGNGITVSVTVGGTTKTVEINPRPMCGKAIPTIRAVAASPLTCLRARRGSQFRCLTP